MYLQHATTTMSAASPVGEPSTSGCPLAYPPDPASATSAASAVVGLTLRHSFSILLTTAAMEASNADPSLAAEAVVSAHGCVSLLLPGWVLNERARQTV